jgi:spore coat protein CotH
MTIGWIPASLLFFALMFSPGSRSSAADGPPTRSADLFGQTKVWTTHLTFVADQWEAMEPKGGGGGFSAMFAGGRNGRAGAGAAGLLASAMVKRGDRNRDGTLDRDEFGALGGAWFDRWDLARAGALDAVAVETGLNSLLDPEGAAQGSGFPISLRGAEGRRNGLASVFGIDFKQVHATLEFAGTEFKDVGVRYKGNGTFVDSRKSLKRSLKVELNEFAKGQKLAGVAKLNFHNNVTDASGMSEAIAYRLYRDAGVPVPRTAYAKVYVTVPGKYDRQYLGLYSIVEDIDDHFARERLGAKRGAIFKPVAVSLFADLGDDWSDYKQAYDAKAELTAGQAQRVIDFARLVSHADDAAFAAGIGDYLDLDQFARYMAVTTYLSTLDSILYVGQNYYLYLHPRTNKFQFIPWDLDHAFGQIFGEQEQLANLSIHKPWVAPNHFLERVFKVEAFKKAYLSHLDEFSRTIFKAERFHAQVDEIAVAIRPAVEAESKEKVAAFDRTVAGAPIKAAGGWFAPKPIKSIKGFVDARTPSVLDQLAGKREGEPAKGMGGAWGGRGGQAPGKLLAPVFVTTMDADNDGKVSRAEFAAGFATWFETWDTDADGLLTDGELQVGANKALVPH